MNASNRLLHVVFGTGPVGMAIIAELTKQDVQIRAVNRSGQTEGPLPERVELVNGDVMDAAFARQAAEGAAVVYFALNPPYHKWGELFPPLQANVLAAAEATGARLVAMENLYTYGDPDGQPIYEGMPEEPHTHKGKVRLAMHHELMAAHEAGRVQVVTGRASDFFGPFVRESAMGERVFAAAVVGKPAQYIGDLSMPHSQTYMPDIGRALVALACADDAYGKAWLLPNAPAMTQGEFIEAVYGAAGTEPRIQTIPGWLLTVMGIFFPTLGEMKEMVYEFERPFTVDSSPFEARFGFGATPTDEAIRTTVAWYRAQAA